jgi:cytochrome c556
MPKKVLLWGLVLAMAGAAAGAAFAQFARTEDAVKYRQSVMFLIGQHYTRMGAMVKGEVPFEKERFAADAAVVETLSALPWEAFMAPGSDKGSGMRAEALAEKDRFAAAAKANRAEIGKLAAAARAGESGAIRAQFGETGKSCKACHDAYRNK